MTTKEASLLRKGANFMFWAVHTFRPIIVNLLIEHESHCGGKNQSPINIESKDAIIANYPEFIFHNYELVFPEGLENNGNTEQGMGAELPLITGGGLTDRYNFVQLHFHWGRSFSSSEHRIDGEQCKVDQIAYDIRPNCTWPITIRNTELLASSLQPRDNIAFRHLEQFDNIIDPSIAKSDELRLRYSVPLSDLLPGNTDSFFRYNGSLTTGNCNEDVIWTIFDTPIAISERQISTLMTEAKQNEMLINDFYTPSILFFTPPIPLINLRFTSY
ncbi:carbonic anhydrase 4-like [Daphnia pulicaria]|uniref:carbonic anhydrase 4-like n=1 Tax=Daphnia pulicaria TaxID=35523 RepID=UPI001EEA30D0|nr:carbonic anhydrase 4-like [Daphnia pulicaria]